MHSIANIAPNIANIAFAFAVPNPATSAQTSATSAFVFPPPATTPEDTHVI